MTREGCNVIATSGATIVTLIIVILIPHSLSGIVPIIFESKEIKKPTALAPESYGTVYNISA